MDQEKSFFMCCGRESVGDDLFCRQCHQGDYFKESGGIPKAGEVCEISSFTTNEWSVITVTASGNGKMLFEYCGKPGVCLTKTYKFRPIVVPAITH